TGNLIIITSPSGGRKGTLITELMKRGVGIGYSVSYTTRPIRPGEADGQDYSFIPVEEFEKRIADGEFLEYAKVHDNYYGTSKSRVERLIGEGVDVILEIDVQGAADVLKTLPDAVSIFILPPSFEALAHRLRARNTENPEQLKLRLRNSFDEVRRFDEFDYVVINDNIADAVRRLESIIVGERQRRTRQTDAIKDILDSFDASKYIIKEQS
ncbi:MAG: guanylate kinase, partial [Acidobacteria bacterium]|nr:guanylate kinase [Acidobacteriota bacterium]